MANAYVQVIYNLAMEGVLSDEMCGFVSCLIKALDECNEIAIL